MPLYAKWKVLPAFKTRQDGDSVIISDHIQLQCDRFKVNRGVGRLVVLSGCVNAGAIRELRAY